VAKRRLLAVDDDPVILNLVKMNFEMEGFEVLTAVDGEEGLQVARDEKPDVVVLDIMMPKMSGLEVCHILKSEAATKAIPIVLLSAKAQEADVHAGLTLGADSYVTKPFDPLELTQQVLDLLSDSKG
jgi:DNA-binding response OmpR family regulator